MSYISAPKCGLQQHREIELTKQINTESQGYICPLSWLCSNFHKAVLTGYVWPWPKRSLQLLNTGARDKPPIAANKTWRYPQSHQATQWPSGTVPYGKGGPSYRLQINTYTHKGFFCKGQCYFQLQERPSPASILSSPSAQCGQWWKSECASSWPGLYMGSLGGSVR